MSKKQEVEKTTDKTEQISRIRRFIEKMGKAAGLSEEELSLLFLAPTEDIPEIGHRWIDMEENADRTLDITVSHWFDQYVSQNKRSPSDDEILQAYARFDRARIQAMRHDLRQVIFDTLANFKNNVFVTSQDRIEFSQPITHDRITIPIAFPPEEEWIAELRKKRSREQVILGRAFPEESE